VSEYVVTWDDSKIIPTLKQEICDKLGDKAWDVLVDGIDVPHHETEKKLGCRNMRVIIERLEKMADRETVKGILMRVRHGFDYMPPSGPSKEFIECDCNIDVYLEQCRNRCKEEYVRHNAEGTEYWGDLITDEALDYLLSTEGVLSPVRKGSQLHIAMHPYDMTNYFRETDTHKKRFHYCHCLFARTSILSNEGTVSQTMCYCSLGRVVSAWGETLGVELDGEVVKSVLGGDDICEFIIHLPDSIIKNTCEREESP
jgi:hypothetical protein